MQGAVSMKALLLVCLVGMASAFQAGVAMPALRSGGLRAQASLRRSSPSVSSAGIAGGLRMQRQTNVEEETAEEVAQVPEQAEVPTAGPTGSWFERTTSQDRNLREGGDPLAPKREGVVQRVPKSQTLMDVEREGYEWYKNQESKKSVFGRTLNPLTGSLEKKDDNAKTMNLFEDPIFYIVLIFGAPTAILLGAAQACLVPALSMSVGVMCEF